MALPDISSAGSAAPAPPTTPTKSASTATSSGLATPTSVADVKSLIVGWVLDPVNLPKPGAPPMTSVSLYVHARVRDRRRPFRRSAPSRRAALEVAQWLEAVAGTAVVLASTSAAATTAGMAEGSNGPATLGRPASALAVPVLVARLLNGPGLETSGTLSAPSAMLHRTQSMSRACRTLTSHASGAEVVGGNGRIGSGSPLRIATAAMSSSSPLRPIRHARSASDTRISYIPRGPQPSPPTSTSRGDADAVVDEDVVRPRGQSTPVLLGQDLCGTESAAAAIGSATLEARARAAVVVSRQWSRWSWRSGGAGGMIDERAWVAESVRLLAGMMRAGWTAIAGRVSWRRAGTNQ
ncbi:hypothetical protein BC828DRAFT_394921 [Blastocladiella britannica]|nr:hypothetical protein BC828DRAFT_394921 [Blastocladiella britannica]